MAQEQAMDEVPPEQEPSGEQKESDGSEWKNLKKLPRWIYMVGVFVVIVIVAGVYFWLK